MKKIFLALALCAPLMMSAAETDNNTTATTPVVYFTTDITPEALVKVYKALGVPATGRVAVKISTGESTMTHHLTPALIAPLVHEVNGTLVECNTAYRGSRFNTADHRRAIAQRGYNDIANVDIMDEFGSIDIPMADTTHMKFDRVGAHLANYDFMINLAHFKGHAMGGFGGVLKNQSIGVASSEGKALIHTSGTHLSTDKVFDNPKGQDAFLESMAGAAQAVHNYLHGNVLYINVMNNLSVDCDCNAHPEAPHMKDVGILASTDPVALDKACLDLVFTHVSTDGDNSAPLIQRINRQHGTHIVDYAQQIGLGSKSYRLVDITATTDDNITAGVEKYNVYDGEGNRVLTDADNLLSLPAGTYIVNGRKIIFE